MAEVKRWQEVNAQLMGLAVLQALVNAERGVGGEIDLDLGGRWVKLSTDPRWARVVLFEINTPQELDGDGKEVG